MQPVRILKEYWGPAGKGRKKFSQRLFQVLFTDGSKEVLVAEDVVDGWAEPFEENEYFTVPSLWTGVRNTQNPLAPLARDVSHTVMHVSLINCAQSSGVCWKSSADESIRLSFQCCKL